MRSKDVTRTEPRSLVMGTPEMSLRLHLGDAKDEADARLDLHRTLLAFVRALACDAARADNHALRETRDANA